jgi:hypothetical protein
VTSAKAAHTEAATAFGLRAVGNKAAGKHCACQNHHRSSSHDILHLIGRIVPPQDPVRHWRVQQMPTSRYNGDENAWLFSQLNSSLRVYLSQRKRTQDREFADPARLFKFNLNRRQGAVAIAAFSKPVERIIKAMDGQPLG